MINITKVNELHDLAMSQADQAILAKKRGDTELAHQYARRAFELESEAARLMEDTSTEPTRSVLYRSAATLAIECNEIREAERLIAAALMGDPPIEIATELRNLWKEAIATVI